MIRSTNTLRALLLCAGLIPGIALAADDNGGPAKFLPKPLDATPGSLLANNGHFLCTAAINTDGTIAGGRYVNTSVALTFRISTGTYQVAFTSPCNPVNIAKGYFRVIQRDTLTTGTLPGGDCNVADRAGVPSALWIQCFNPTGALVDTSFTVSVSR